MSVSYPLSYLNNELYVMFITDFPYKKPDFKSNQL